MVLPLFTRYVNIFGLFAFTGALCVLAVVWCVDYVQSVAGPFS